MRIVQMAWAVTIGRCRIALKNADTIVGMEWLNCSSCQVVQFAWVCYMFFWVKSREGDDEDGPASGLAWGLIRPGAWILAVVTYPTNKETGSTNQQKLQEKRYGSRAELATEHLTGNV